MSRIKHPHSRAERLALKKLDEKKPKHADKVRRRVKESLKDWETRNELEQVAHGRITPSSDP